MDIFDIRYCTGGCKDPEHQAHVYSFDPVDGPLGRTCLCPGNKGNVMEILDEDGKPTLQGFMSPEFENVCKK